MHSVCQYCNQHTQRKYQLFLVPSGTNFATAAWTKQVQRTHDWTGPTINSVLCSEHFTKDCIEIDMEYAAKYAGQKKRRRLVKGAIPMIFKKKSDTPSSASSNSGSSSLKRAVHPGENETLKKRQALEKRERSRVSAHYSWLTVYQCNRIASLHIIKNDMLCRLSRRHYKQLHPYIYMQPGGRPVVLSQNPWSAHSR